MGRARARAANSAQRTSDAFKAALDTNGTLGAGNFGALTNALSGIKNVAQNEVQPAFKGLSSSLDAFLSGGVKGFKDFAKNAILEIGKIQLKALAFKALGIGGGGGGNPFGKLLGGIFGGFREKGGPVNSGKSYIVGEKGPELFTPDTIGRIIPNGEGVQSSKAAGGGIVQNITLSPGVSREELIITLEEFDRVNQEIMQRTFAEGGAGAAALTY